VVWLAPRAREESVRSRRLSDVVARPLNFTVRRRVLQLIRNSVSCLVVFVLTIVSWFYGAQYWSHAFLLGRTFESRWTLDPTWLFFVWGFDFLLALLAGFALFLLVKGKRPLLWVAGFGLGLLALRIRFTKHWISPDADWGVYVQDYGIYVMPLVGALLGGLLAQRVRAMQHSGRAA